jgi:hypothetical protein
VLAGVVLSPAAVQTDSVQSWKSGETTVTLKDGTLTVSGNGAMADYDSEWRIGKDMSNASPWFDVRYYITGLIIEDGVTSIGNGAFMGTCRPTYVTIPNSVTYIGENAFGGLELTSITIPGSVRVIGNRAFDYCDRLTSVIIEDGVTIIGEAAFVNCHGLTSITIPGSVISIGDGAFMACNKLAYVTIGNGLARIGAEAFRNCNLASVTIPKSVTYIGDGAFSHCCDEQTSITILNPRPSELGFDPFSNVYLYVPARSYFAYRSTDVWNEYGIKVFFNIYEIIVLSVLLALLLSAAVFAIIKNSRKAKASSAPCGQAAA